MRRGQSSYHIIYEERTGQIQTVGSKKLGLSDQVDIIRNVHMKKEKKEKYIMPQQKAGQAISSEELAGQPISSEELAGHAISSE